MTLLEAVFLCIGICIGIVFGMAGSYLIIRGSELGKRL